MVRLLATLALVFFLVPSGSNATTVRVDFEGVIDDVEDPGGILGPDFSLAAPFHGHFELDVTTALESSSGFFNLPPGFFLFPVIPFGITGPSTLSGSVTVGSSQTTSLQRFGPLGEAIFISSTAPTEAGQADFYLVPFERFPAFPTPLALESCSMALVDTSGTANPGGFYVPANLEAFDSATFGCSLPTETVVFGEAAPPRGGFSGAITRWTVTPEPSSWWLLASAAGLTLGWRRPRS
jgi:hypothetical protein